MIFKIFRIIRFAFKSYFEELKEKIAFDRFIIEWKEKNTHNSTMPKIMFPISKVTVGKGTYGELDIRTFSDPNEAVKIGSFCSIAKDVVFVAGGRHSTDFFSTFPFKAMYNLPVDRKDSFSKGPIIVEDDVWIGTRAIILDNTLIGKGSIIGAGCIVSKDVPPYSIVVGNPQRIIKARLDPKITKKLYDFDCQKLDVDTIIENIELFYENIDDNTLDDIKSLI